MNISLQSDWQRNRRNHANLTVSIRKKREILIKDIGRPNFDENGVWETKETCVEYEMILDPGRYILEAWGASGGYYIKAEASPGGHSIGELTLTTTTRLFAIAGSTGDSAAGPAKIARGGCNGGGDGWTSSDRSSYFSGGGGASHVSLLKNELSYRILVAAGSGGSYYYTGYIGKA